MHGQPYPVIINFQNKNLIEIMNAVQFELVRLSFKHKVDRNIYSANFNLIHDFAYFVKIQIIMKGFEAENTVQLYL